jgi:vacuolar-type H+-ATPase subunit D/Vma8
VTIDDGTTITLVGGIIVALASAVGWLWKAMDKRYQTELAKRDATIEDLAKRLRALEDERIPTYQAHADKLEALTNRADATEGRVADAITAMTKAVREIAANVNSQTEAIKGVKCKTFNQDALPEPHPAAAGTEAVTRKNRDHA